MVLKDDHPSMAWIPEYAGFLLSRFQVAADGKITHERLKGKSYRRALVDFGERFMFMPTAHGGRLNKLEPKLDFGLFCGTRPRSDEASIMTLDGVKKARTFRRLPEPDRWITDDWEELKGLPWLWKPTRAKMPGSSPIPISDAPLPVQVASEKQPAKPRMVSHQKTAH